MVKAAGCSAPCVLRVVPSRVRGFCAKQMSSTTTLNPCPICLPFRAGLSCCPAPRIEGGEAVPGAGRDSLGLLDASREPRRALSLPGKASPCCQGRNRDRNSTWGRRGSRAGTSISWGWDRAFQSGEEAFFHTEFQDVRFYWIRAVCCPLLHPASSSPHLLLGELSSWGCVCRA